VRRLTCLRILASIAAALSLAAPISASKASDVFHKAEKEEKAGHVVQAYLLYAEAAALDSNNEIYRARSVALQAKAAKAQASDVSPNSSPNSSKDAPKSDGAATHSDIADPDLTTTVTSRELELARRALPPPQLNLPAGKFDFHVSGDAKAVFNQIAQRCGLQTQFDSDFDKSPLKVRFDITDVNCREALHDAEAATNSFVVPLSSKLIFVSQDTTTKRVDNEQTMSVIVPVPTALTTQELAEIAQAVRQTTGVEKLSWVAASN
jgi:hypothetical protein